MTTSDPQKKPVAKYQAKQKRLVVRFGAETKNAIRTGCRKAGYTIREVLFAGLKALKIKIPGVNDV